MTDQCEPQKMYPVTLRLQGGDEMPFDISLADIDSFLRDRDGLANLDRDPFDKIVIAILLSRDVFVVGGHVPTANGDRLRCVFRSEFVSAVMERPKSGALEYLPRSALINSEAQG